MDMETLAREFLLHLEAERDYSPLTIGSYRSDLCQFIAYLATGYQPAGPRKITTSMLRAWVVDMKRRGLGARSIARHICTVRSFWRYLLDVEVVDHDLMRRIGSPKAPRSLPTNLNAKELRRLLQAAQKQRLALCAFRDHAER